MKRVKIAELKDRLSEHLRAVEGGAQLEITDRQRPIVRLVPVSQAGRVVSLIPARRPFSEVRRKRYRPARWSVDSLRILRTERGQR